MTSYSSPWRLIATPLAQKALEQIGRDWDRALGRLKSFVEKKR